MTHKLNDVPIKKTAIEHYLFALGQSIEKTAEIFGEDEEYVRQIHDDHTRTIMWTRIRK